MFRRTLALMLMLVGGSLVGNAALFYPSLGALPSRLIAALIGTLFLGGGILLIARRGLSGLSTTTISPLRTGLCDGFTVFGLASLAFNTLMLMSNKCDLDPPFDVLHFIPAIFMNAVWEGLICSSGGSFLLTAGGIALFDACIGSLIGFALFPLRRFASPRAFWIVVLLICYAVFQASLIRWMEFRC